MEMYAAFQKELYGRKVIWDNNGFIVYKPQEDGSMYLHSIYVDSSKRLKGAASILIEKVIFQEDPVSLSSYVDTSAKNFNESLKAHLAYGFNIIQTTESAIILYKELK